MLATNVERIMSQPVVGVSPAMPASEALELAQEHRIHHLAVVEHGHAIGMVCTCNLEDSEPLASVRASMRCPPLSTGCLASAEEALQLMNRHQVGSLLVLNDRKLVGIVTRRDLQQSGLAMFEDPRGFCSCCGSLAHLRAHVTGALCADCADRSRASQVYEHGGGD
jgi:CBS-domain-containing membrane protein